jgi:phosphoglycerate dehydrogenase-like enzyme
MGERLVVLATPHFVVRPDQLARLADAHPRVEVRFPTSAEEFAGLIADADATLGAFGPPEPWLGRAPKLRWFQALGAGVTGALTSQLGAANVTLTATKGPMNTLMAEHVLALMLALARNLPAHFRDQQAHRWTRYPRDRGPSIELVGKTVLVLGVGGVGGEVARMCKQGFRMRVLGLARATRDNPNVDRYVDRPRLREALGDADFVSLTMPLTPATDRIIGAAELAAMAPTAYLLNVARGQLVDEPALIEALRAGRIAGAGLDALATEPLPAESPLWDMPNVIITPHSSAITERLGDHFVDFWRENVRRFAEGEALLGLVDLQAGY